MAGRARTLIRSLIQALKALNLIGCLFHLHSHRQIVDGRHLSCVAPRSRSSRKNSSGGTKNGFSWRMPPMMIIGWVRIMSTTISPAKLGEIVCSYDRVFIPGQNIVQPRLVLHQVIDTRSVFQGPFHMGDQTSQRETLAVYRPQGPLGSKQASYPDRSGHRANTHQPSCAARTGRSVLPRPHRCRRTLNRRKCSLT